MNKKPHIGFYGGVGSVTGANFLLDTGEQKILVDCGLFQGRQVCDDANYDPFPYDPKTIDALFVTHAHLDHIGRIPRLVREGFGGTVYSTPETLEIARLMLGDAHRIIAEEAAECGREAPYDAHDVERTFLNWKTLPYYTPETLGNVSVKLRNSGHILGSAMVEVASKEFGTLVFTGDLGNHGSVMLPEADVIEDADWLVMESVYGNRVHEPQQERSRMLEEIVEYVIARGGALLIPAFSIERTQTILYELGLLLKRQKIPRIPVFLDSPLAIKVTEVYRKAADKFNEETRKAIAAGGDVFSFPDLALTNSVEESKAINEVAGPKIIIAGSGMSHGGRIMHHERRYLPDHNSALLIVGYQAPGSVGRQLEDGAKEVTISGEAVPVRARVKAIHAYSGHRDLDGLIEVAAATRASLKKAFVTMGEPAASQFLVQRLRDYLGIDAVLPQLGETFELK